MPKIDLFKPLYEVFDKFLDRCIYSDQSLIWPEEQVWTLENLQELDQRFIQNPIDDPNLPFDQKLRRQIGEERSALWAVVADLFYIYYLTSRSTKTSTKIQKIQQFNDYVLFPFPPEENHIWVPLQMGLCNTGQFYNLKYRQFALMILFFIALKRLDEPRSVLENSEAFQKLIDPIMEEQGAYDMRCALLYLSFPDKYEAIISKTHKQQIIDTYSPQIQDGLPSDMDESLLRIRDHLQGSRQELPVPFHFYNEPIHGEWAEGGNPPPPPPPPPPPQPPSPTDSVVIQQINRSLRFNKNIILYGPPGSGKTYQAGQFAKKFVAVQLNEKPKELVYQQIIDELTVYQLIALAMVDKDKNGQFSVPEIRELDLIKTRYQMNPIRNPNEAIWGVLQQHANPDSSFIHYAMRSDPILFDRLEEAKWYLTNEGKEYIETTLPDYLVMLKAEPETSQLSDYISQVTFHQSFSYEEFVEGIRPTVDPDRVGQTIIDVVPGIFREVCAKALATPDKQFVLIIDEINRGNISRVFGELITTIENDKRLGSPNQISVELPYSKESFTVPANLIIIGTMNTADRSIALMDTALRRRFAFIEVPSDPTLLGDAEISDGERAIRLQDLLDMLNRKITVFVDRDHQIGHSYFLQVAALPEGNRLSAFEYVWNYQILPLLEEYFYSRPDQLREVLPNFVEDDEEEEITRSMHLARYPEDQLLIMLTDLINRQ